MLRPGALGDTLLAVPALRALRRKFGWLQLAAHGGAARLLAALGEVDDGIAFDDPSLAWLFEDSSQAGVVEAAAQTGDPSLSSVDDTSQAGVVEASAPTGDSPGSRQDPRQRARGSGRRGRPLAPSRGAVGGERSSAEDIVAWMNPAGAAGVAGLQQALLVAPSRPAGDEHCARYLLRSLAPLGVDPFFDERPLEVRAQASGEVLVHPGSGSLAKNWPAERFAATIAALDRPVRLIVGEADAGAADAVEACLGRALPRLTQLPLAELARRLAGCHAYLGNDSGVSHLAGLCGAPSVVLFGPTPPTVWRPLGPRVHVLTFDAPVLEVASLLHHPAPP